VPHEGDTRGSRHSCAVLVLGGDHSNRHADPPGLPPGCSQAEISGLTGPQLLQREHDCLEANRAQFGGPPIDLPAFAPAAPAPNPYPDCNQATAEERAVCGDQHIAGQR
jgi:hypothetical protein